MKSIMEQASSVIKAIEKAWISADKPKEFSVKIFEKEEKNFFGLTTKPAKIGIFFSDKATQPQEKSVQKCRTEIRETVSKPVERKIIKEEKQKIERSPIKTAQPQTQQTQQTPVAHTWNSAMIDAVKTWIDKTLPLMGIGVVNFDSEIAGKILKVTFVKPLHENQFTEKNMFRSIAHLVMASLRNQYKKEIKDLKIVLIRPQ